MTPITLSGPQRSRRALHFVLPLLALGCTHSTPTPPPPAAPADATSRLQSPLSIWWDEGSLSATGAHLVAHVKRIAPMNLPVVVRLEVPAGAKLVDGRASFTLDPNTEAVDWAEVVTLAFDAVPADDLVLHADAEAPSTGFHFSAPYRFGRAAPLPTAAQPEGPPVKKGDRNLGSSVPLK